MIYRASISTPVKFVAVTFSVSQFAHGKGATGRLDEKYYRCVLGEPLHLLVLVSHTEIISGHGAFAVLSWPAAAEHVHAHGEHPEMPPKGTYRHFLVR